MTASAVTAAEVGNDFEMAAKGRKLGVETVNESTATMQQNQWFPLAVHLKVNFNSIGLDILSPSPVVRP